MGFSLALIREGAKAIGKEAIKRSPGIMAGLAAGGVLVTAYLALKEGPKAAEIVNQKRRDLEDIPPADKETRRLIRMEMIKELAPVIGPVLISSAATIALIFGSHKVSVRRLAGLTSAYEVTSTAFKEYKEKTRKIVGEKKEAKITEEATRDYMKEYPLDGCGQKAIVTGKGDYNFFDKRLGRYFESDIEFIRYKVNTLNQRLLTEMWISQNEFYYELGLPSVYGGDYMGWNLDSGLIEIDTTWLSDEMNRPYCVITYDLEPRYRFGDM